MKKGFTLLDLMLFLKSYVQITYEPEECKKIGNDPKVDKRKL